MTTEDAQRQRVPDVTQEDESQRVPENDESQRVSDKDLEEEHEEDDAVLMPGLEVTYPSLKDVKLNPPTVA